MSAWALLPSSSGGGGAAEDANEATLQEGARLHKLARAVDELVAWSFLMDEKAAALQELEQVVDDAERQLEQAEQALAHQRRRCALIPGPADVGHARRGVLRPPPHAAGGEDCGLSALWQEHGGAFTRQYERHLARYQRLWWELLEEPRATSATH
ncbi:uncharacterized protein Tco025E_08175 [Trypanosoma conorhini]|uniref:Uncharacterized protein n=1 Tax=Trypanosoma conorhini TaxID=83891 RepID=A0A422ND93_9TRYP|nr:uncharacterized protein Tco025E_08175 [Trypanosoma conorhini]RNF03443.1 hypothetical protein Tco025E_08175 [Trypanosoma conorhini]